MKKGWQRKKISDLCKVIAGQSPEGKFYNINGDGMPFYQGKKDFGEKFIESPTTWTTQSTKIAKEGDILMSVRAPVGPVNFSTEEICIGRGLAAIRSSDEINRDFLFYQLQHLQSDISGKEGAVFASINKSEIEALQVAFVSLPEQKRIVGILDEAFDGIATAKANAGKNLKNARAIFESHLESVFTQRGEGWVETTLSKATGGIFTGPFGSLLHKSDYVAHGIPLVNPAHITEVGIEPDSCKTVSKETAIRLKSYIMSEGDIVIGRRGEMGRCALVTEVEDGWLCGTGSFFIKPSNRCDTRFLVRFLRSEGCKGRLEKIAGGAVMPNLSNTDLGNLHFDLPPLDRQKAIVEEIDDLHEETQHLESIYQRKLGTLESLKKSLLHQAFAGEL
ncbi:type I restriction enzyme, S subunit [Gammaproteobacteria bacterium]